MMALSNEIHILIVLSVEQTNNEKTGRKTNETLKRTQTIPFHCLMLQWMQSNVS